VKKIIYQLLKKYQQNRTISQSKYHLFSIIDIISSQILNLPCRSFRAVFKVIVRDETNIISNENEKTFVIKYIFNMESLDRETEIRNKYTQDLKILSILPLHSNILFHIGHFVDFLPQIFIEQLAEKDYYVELARKKINVYYISLHICNIR